MTFINLIVVLFLLSGCSFVSENSRLSGNPYGAYTQDNIYPQKERTALGNKVIIELGLYEQFEVLSVSVLQSTLREPSVVRIMASSRKYKTMMYYIFAENHTYGWTLQRILRTSEVQ